MVVEKKSVHTRIINIAGVPSARPKDEKTYTHVPRLSSPERPPKPPTPVMRQSPDLHSVSGGVGVSTPPVTPPSTPLVPPPVRPVPPSESPSPFGMPVLLWWFDDKTLKCQQKQFGGAYMYDGLRTFETKGECEKALQEVLGPPIPAPLPAVRNIRTTELKYNFARVEWDKVEAKDVAYKVWLDGVARGTAVKEPRIELPGLRSGKRYKVEIRTQPYSRMDRRAPSEKVTYYFTTPPVTPHTKEPIWYFDEETLKCKKLGENEPISKSMSTHRFKSSRECEIELRKYMRKTRDIPLRKPSIMTDRQKRKLSERAEEIMKKRQFPKAVREAIEKGLEKKEAPRDIERIIEKVAKTNEPDYILKRQLAKRIMRGGVLQYKIETDKGTIIYESADERTKNAILGLPMPTGEVIPLQIKVVR